MMTNAPPERWIFFGYLSAAKTRMFGYAESGATSRRRGRLLFGGLVSRRSRLGLASS